MGELTIEAKAKAYDYAVNKAKELILNENGVVRVDKPLFDELFPSEMEESEDERIRKGLIEYFKDFRLGTFAYLEPKKIIAWLEKQGEEIIPLKEIILNVWELGNYWKELTKGICNTEHGTQLDYIVKHWKEGEHYIKSFNKQGEQKPAEWGDKDDLRYCIDYVRPQHPTHDNGSVNIRHYRIPSFVGDKGAESILSVILSFGAKIVALYRGNVREGKLDEWNTPFIVDKEDWYTEEWLKSIKDRYAWKPSDEQIGALEHFVRSITESGFASPYDSNTKLVYSLLNDLKKLKL